jgi:hypothetical protein
MKFMSAILPVLLIAFMPGILLAQSNQANHKVNIEIPEVALLGLVSEDAGQVSLDVSAPSEAGSTIDFSTAQPDNSFWINYSSIIRSQHHRRKVIAVIQGDIPAGVRLFVEASQATGNGNGKLGQPVGKVALSGQPADVISDIGSCYTGVGTSNGHLLTYRLEADEAGNNLQSLTQQQASLNVVYTLTDHN